MDYLIALFTWYIATLLTIGIYEIAKGNTTPKEYIKAIGGAFTDLADSFTNKQER